MSHTTRVLGVSAVSGRLTDLPVSPVAVICISGHLPRPMDYGVFVSPDHPSAAFSTRLSRCADDAMQAGQRWLSSGIVPGGDTPTQSMAERALLDLRLLVRPDGAEIAAWHSIWKYGRCRLGSVGCLVVEHRCQATQYRYGEPRAQPIVAHGNGGCERGYAFAQCRWIAHRRDGLLRPGSDWPGASGVTWTPRLLDSDYGWTSFRRSPRPADRSAVKAAITGKRPVTLLAAAMVHVLAARQGKLRAEPY
jgi:hypothetical protein